MSELKTFAGVTDVALCIGSIVKPLLGPGRSVKCVVDDSETLYIKDVLLLLEHLDIEHPVGQYVVQVCRSFLQRYKTGGTTLLVFISSLVKAALSLQDQGLSMFEGLQHLREAVGECIQIVEASKISIQEVLSWKQGRNGSRISNSRYSSSTETATQIVTGQQKGDMGYEGTQSEGMFPWQQKLSDSHSQSHSNVEAEGWEYEDSGFCMVQLKMDSKANTAKSEIQTEPSSNSVICGSEVIGTEGGFNRIAREEEEEEEEEEEKADIPVVHLQMKLSQARQSDDDSDISWFFEGPGIPGVEEIDVDSIRKLLTSNDTLDCAGSMSKAETKSLNIDQTSDVKTSPLADSDSDSDFDSCFDDVRGDNSGMASSVRVTYSDAVPVDADDEFDSCFDTDSKDLESLVTCADGVESMKKKSLRALDVASIDKLLAGIGSKQSISASQMLNGSRHFKTFETSHNAARFETKLSHECDGDKVNVHVTEARQSTDGHVNIVGVAESKQSTASGKGKELATVKDLLKGIEQKGKGPVGVQVLHSSSRHFSHMASSTETPVGLDSCVDTGHYSSLKTPEIHLKKTNPSSGSDSSLITSNSTVTSDSSLKTPYSSMRSPDSSFKTPDSSFKTPDSSLKTPDSSLKTIDSSLKAPGSSLTTPDSNHAVLSTNGVYELVEAFSPGAGPDVVKTVSDLVQLHTGETDSPVLRLDSDRVHCTSVIGGGVQGASVVRGLVLKTSSQQMAAVAQLHGRSCRALLVNGDVRDTFRHKGYKKIEGCKMVTSAHQFLSQDHVTRDDQWLLEVKHVFRELSVDVILVRGQICPDVLDLCESAGIVAMDNVPYRVLDVLSVAMKTNLATYVTEANQVNCGVVHLLPWQPDWMDRKGSGTGSGHDLVITVPDTMVTTAVLSSLTTVLAGLKEQEFWDCLYRVTSALQDYAVVPGCYGTEEICAKFCRQRAEELTSSGPGKMYLQAAFLALEGAFQDYANVVKGNMAQYTLGPRDYCSFTSVDHFELQSHHDGCHDNSESCVQCCPKDTVFDQFEVNCLRSGDVARSSHRGVPMHCRSCGDDGGGLSKEILSDTPELMFYDECRSKVAAWRTAVDTVCVLLQTDSYIITGLTEEDKTLNKGTVLL